MLIDSFNIFSEKIVHFCPLLRERLRITVRGKHLRDAFFHVYQPDFYLWLGYLAS